MLCCTSWQSSTHFTNSGRRKVQEKGGLDRQTGQQAALWFLQGKPTLLCFLWYWKITSFLKNETKPLCNIHIEYTLLSYLVLNRFILIKICHTSAQSLISFNALSFDLFYSIRRGPFFIQHIIAVFAHAVYAKNNKKLMKKSTGCNELVILLDLYLELIFIVMCRRWSIGICNQVVCAFHLLRLVL